MPKKPDKPDKASEQCLSDMHSYCVNLNARELYLHGHYGGDGEEEPGVEYRMSSTFMKNLHLMESQSNNNILVHSLTVGGCWNNGMAIFDLIKFSKCPITLLAHAWARSMSSIIPQAADRRVIMPNADFMVHYGTGGIQDHVLNVISEAKWEEKATERMLRIYAKRCIYGEHFQKRYKSITEEKVMSFIEKQMKDHHDWWISSEEAVYYGFMDGILGEPGFETIDKIRVNRKAKF
jgi:ATP-dependent protease ClpP protease subunit